ncbi:AraC-like DNA-binding protein [Pseudochelatococcus lubricantis]|uniref:AraC-like DNA-binding protein n=1 Tax=Pseudochelatococcus lubricantis TaxID=1538102 RepID=A0ABX0V3Z5_9HYPH|nr:AraC family transcriptional regulator [Pseudochelatococcus lubricantis]NIJ59921.1 AraC-like DNA-binding protein [Pseudochelatococcus lubricantis]
MPNETLPRDVQTLASLVRAEPLRPALRSVILRPSRGMYEEFTHFLLVETGDVTIEADDSGHRLEGPVAMILPPAPAMAVRLGAGAGGWLLGAAPPVLTEAVGAKAESGLLQTVSARLVVAQGEDGRFIPDLVHLAEQIHREMHRETRGSQMAVVACLRLLLISFWREGSFDPATLGRSSELHLLQGFRRLVELHFRSRMSVADYAALLGVTYDRLHSICRRSLQRSPLQLVHQRMMREAAIRLERSGETIQEIAHSLGFGDATEFSHFFKRKSRMAPSTFRARVRDAGGTAHIGGASFADWP